VLRALGRPQRGGSTSAETAEEETDADGELHAPPAPQLLLGVTRVTALSTADIYEIPPAAAARLIAVERPDLLFSLIANAREELGLATASGASSAVAGSAAPAAAAVLERWGCTR
jgi:hypothetical protein